MTPMLIQVKSGTEQILLNGLPLTDLFTVLTFFLLIITIAVSVRALKETARSNILSSSPVLVLKYSLAKGLGSDSIHVENVGHGAALNVRVESYYTTFLDDMTYIKGDKVMPNKPIHAILKFEPVDLVLEGKTVPFDTSKSRGGGFFTTDILTHHMMSQKGKLTFRLRYSDITGTQYISKIIISQNRIRVVGHPKRYNAFRKILYFFYLCYEWIRMVTVFRPVAMFRQIKVNKEIKENNKKRNQL